MINAAVRIQGYCRGAELPITLKVLNFVVKSYEEVENGIEYLKDSIRVCRHFIISGIKPDEMLAATLLYKASKRIRILDEEIKKRFGQEVFNRMNLFFREGNFELKSLTEDDCVCEEMHKEAVYIKGFAEGAELPLTLRALSYATEKFEGKKRKDGSDAITHSLNVCRYLINHGMRDDVTLASALLHDTIEDTDATKMELSFTFTVEVADIVNALSKIEWIPADEYYVEMRKDVRAIIIKAADRTCNFDTAIRVYNADKLESYIAETEDYILPNMKWARKLYLEYGDLLVALRDHIKGVIKAAEEVISLTKENVELKEEVGKLKEEINELSDS